MYITFSMLLKERGESRVVFSVHKLTTKMCTQVLTFLDLGFLPGMVFCLGPILGHDSASLRLPTFLDVIQNLSYAEGKACCRVILGKQTVAMTIAKEIEPLTT